MKQTCFCSFALALVLVVNPFFSRATATATPGKSKGAVREFTSSNATGLIGTTPDLEYDNPADNIFHVRIDETIDRHESVWLVYDLEGVQDHTGVSRSINDQLSVGGYLVKKRRGWATQRERINASWLRKGDNVIRFTVPENAAHSYQVRNLRLEIAEEQVAQQQTPTVVFNQPTLNYYFGKAYVKGFVQGEAQGVTIRIAGKEARIFNGEFESVIDFADAESSCSVEAEMITADGSSKCLLLTFETPVTADLEYSLDSYTYRTEKLFAAGKEHSITLEGASILSGEQSLSANSMLSITTLRAVDIPALDAGMVNVTGKHAGFRFLPHGSTFKQEMFVTIPFDATQIPDGYTEKDIRTYYFDEQAHHWIALPTDTVMLERGLVIAKTTHFTDMINGIIKVPESPEVEAYNSTSMKGIKAANPTAGINLINPPQANNTGSAALSYPISVPAGRNGLQPQLAISYNSGGGNGWIGLGWNLSTPAISIDTRWGVPRYDPIKETETYSLNGEQLTPVAHRGELQNRYAPGKRFFPRVEGAFNQIKRHGDKPWNYWWEVIDKNGTRYFYGADGTGTGFDAGSVLTDNENNKPQKPRNIAYWPLREIRDLNGNTVKYYYSKVPDKGVTQGTVDGWQIYLSRITYTGVNGSDGPYEVIFTRTNVRDDKTISGNLGFKQVTGDLLKKIEVKFNKTEKVRHYELTYAPGQFYKSLLTRITEFDAAGEEFNYHEFKYFNDVAKDSFKPLKQTGVNWNVPPDDINGGFKSDVSGFRDEATALSGTKSKDLNIGLTVSVGLGFNVFAKAASAGISGGYSKSDTEGLLTMMDMNGDGLPDKVFNKGGLHYRPNLLKQTGKEEFGPIKDISGIDAFFFEKSKTTSFGGEAQFGLFVGYSHSRTTSKTTTYVADVNGDQLPDIIKNGRVYFNHLNRETGNITFTPESAGTPNVIYSSLAMSNDLIDRNALELERQEAMAQNPLLDIVRMWRAPYDGDIRITAPVKLLPSSDPARSETTPDGVRLAVQLKDTELWSQDVAGDDYGQHLMQPLTATGVKKGDLLFFRVGSKDNGLYDSVQWEPIIEYLNKPLSQKDANRKPVYKFSSKDDYLLASEQWVTTPLDGTIKVSGSFYKPRTTDNVHMMILKAGLESEDIIDTVWQRKYAWHEKASTFPDIILPVTDEERYLFKVVTSTNIDWTSFTWQPHLSYESVTAGGIDLKEAPIEVYAVPHYSLFVNTLRVTPGYTIKLDSVGQRDTLDFYPILDLQPDPFGLLDGDVTFSVKKTDTLLAIVTLPIVNGQVMLDTALAVPVVHDDTVFVEYHSSNHVLALNIIDAQAEVTIKDEVDTLEAGVFTVIPHNKNDQNDKREDVIYGTLYRGWGHFGWNGNNGWELQPIDRTKLKISDAARQQGEINTSDMDGEGLESSGSNYDAKKDRFFPLIASGADRKWTSGDQYAYLLGDIMSSSRLGDDDLSVVQIAQGGLQGNTGATALDKVNKSRGNAYTYGGSLILSAAKSKSDADSYAMTDFMDMNGDRYPDIVTERIIQYTNALGGLSDLVIPSRGEVQKTHATTDGYTVSGSFPMTMPKFRDGIKKSEKKTEGGDAASTSGSVSLSVGATTGNNNAEYSWMDVNGDGLPDRVNLSGGKVELNLGYGFETAEPWGFGQIQQGGSKTETGGGGLGFNIGQNSISAGISLARSDNHANEILADINGDGLVDKITKGSPLQVYINTGSGFKGPLNWNGATSISESATASESANAAFTVGFSWLGIKWTVSPSVSGGNGMSRELMKITDMNGDGFPDVVRSTADNNLTVMESTIARTNLLKEVKRPLGASFAMDYKQVGNTYEMPNSQWVLSQVKMFDGFNDDPSNKLVDTTMTTFAYEGGLYDRHERDFFGFSKVVTNSHDYAKAGKPVYTQAIQTFKNENYFVKGLLISDVLLDGKGAKYVEKELAFELKDYRQGSKFPALKSTMQRFYEGGSEAGKQTKTTNTYDSIGNIIKFIDEGEEGPEDDVSATIAYHYVESSNIRGIPKSIIVNGAGRSYRKREAFINEATGNVTRIRQHLSESETSDHDMEYDAFGSLIKISRPANSKGQRLTFQYEYDAPTHTYPTKVSNSYGYSSEATYDLRFGQKLLTKDLNGNEISFEIDNAGRVISVTGPYEKAGGNKTIRFEYFPKDSIPWAMTKNFDPANPKNDLHTAIFVDGLGRVLQTKKDIAVFTGDGKADTELMAVSGRVFFDAFGRTVKAYYPVTAPTSSISQFVRDLDSIDPTTTTYDVLNRTLTVTMPDKSITTSTYGFAEDRFNKKQFSTLSVDANGKQTQQFTDIKGKVTSIKHFTTDKAIWTSFKYNEMSEQVEATDDLGHTTYSVYDNFGRRIERRHPDSGTTLYRYDLAGNLTELVTANLASTGGAIRYTYDFERVSEIIYPDNTENNVKYTYGEAGASDNRTGRIVLQEDAAGAQEFFYGPLGEVLKTTRTIVIPQHGEQTYTTEWSYDTWNRITSMTYPDGEKVTYAYNAGGLLRSMNGKKKNSTYNYVNQLGYDKFGQRVFLAYGNGTKTTYNYEPDRRRLKTLTAKTATNRLFMDNAYGYDKVDNILSLENKAPVPSANLMGGSSQYAFEYDDLYRLTSAQGHYKGANDEHSYTLSMDYNSVGSILHKNQHHDKKGNVQKKTSYNLSYSYGETQPHAPVHIGEQTFSYDANGNQIGWTDDISGQRRKLMWDEENRIRAVYDNGAQFHYIYDASGTRVIKGQSTGQRVFVNGEWKAGSGQMGNYTVYVNPYVVLKSGGYTKHYYIEGQRIVSKIGGGWDNNGKGPLTAGNGKVDYAAKGQRVFDGIVKNLKFLGADGQILTAGKSGKVPPGQVNGSGNVSEAFRYFYHPDHLGSTSYVTDASGEVYQHLEYFAFGETFVEEHANTDRTPYLFNGKELDEETGLYYYGARYYDARTSVWLSVDPLTEQYPGWTPYHYVHNNPLNLIDPTGMEAEEGDPKKPKKASEADCKDCKVIGLESGDVGSDVQNQVYTAEFSNVSKEDFERLKGLFTSDPGSVNDNKLATYQLVDMDGDGVVSVNDHVDIDIYGPDNGSVVVQDVAANATGFVAKFATLEGHTDAGWIYFGAFYDEKTQTLTYTINNTTRTNTDMTLVLGIPLAVSRGAQQNQWKRVLGNVARILNGNLTSASMTITEYDYSDSTNTMSTVPEWTKTSDIKGQVIKYSKR
ncbi:MAG TPA: SpvB/TcaC N-terminal domain-containing protein [Chryseosolibacter sp.]